MTSRKLTLIATINIEILNEENFNDFDDSTEALFLVQEMLDQSTWPEAGIDCDVVGVQVNDSPTLR